VANVKKEIQKETLEATKSILKAATTAAQVASGVSVLDDADKKIKGLFEQLKTEHQTVTLKIYRKDLKRESYGLFVVMEGLRIEDVVATGVDVICQDQGGDGMYKINILAGGKDWGQLGPFVISGGLRYDRARLKREEMEAMGGGTGLFTNPAMGSLMGGPQKTGESSFAVRDLASYMGKQSENSQVSMQQSSDRMMQMMMAQQSQQAQMYQQQQAVQQQAQDRQMQMMAMMFGSKQNDAESPELKMMKEELKNLRDEQKRSGELAEIKRELERVRTESKDSEPSTLATMLPLIMNAMSSGDGQTAAMAQIFSSSQQAQQEANNRNMMLLKEIMDKPSEDEKARGFMDTVMTMMGGQVNLVGQMMTNGMMGSSESPAVAMMKQGIDSVTEIAVAAMSRGGEEGEEEVTAAVAPPPIPQRLPLQPAPELLPEHTPAGPMGALEEPQGEEFDFSSDPGLSKIIDLIVGDGHIKEISARMWAHSKSGHMVSNRWISEPESFGIEIMHRFGVEQARFLSITQDIIEFTAYLKEGGNPNAWSADTGYLPVKPRRKMGFDPNAPEPVIEHTDHRNEVPVIEETEVYSPLKAPVEVETEAEFTPNPSITPPAPEVSEAQPEVSEELPA